MSRIFIGRVNPEARTRDLEKFLKDYGFTRTRDINIKLGYAFVEFDDRRDAEDAVYELDKRDFQGSRITVEHAKNTSRTMDRRGGSPPPRGRDGGRGGGGRGGGHGRPYNTEWRLIIENLSSRVGWQDLKDLFRTAGEVTFTKANKDRIGEGVVEFASYKEMKYAIKKLDGTEFFGRNIKIVDDSPGPPSDSRSRSRSRSRSPRRSSRRRSRSKPKSKSKSRSRSRSKSPAASRSRSPSASPAKSNAGSNAGSNDDAD